MLRKQAINVGVLAAKLLIESGSEIWRVEDTTKRIIKCATNENPEAFISLTGVLVSLPRTSYSRFVQVEKRSINMARISKVNQLSRHYTAGKISLDQLERELLGVQASGPQFPIWLQTLAAGMEGALFMYIFTQTYDWRDFPLAFMTSAIGYWVTLYLSTHVRIRFISEFVGALCIGVCAVIGVRLHLGFNVQNIIIGAVMPPVPGIPMITAVRDIFEGNLLSGLERLMESIITLCALAFGIGVVLHYA
ncbi:threonine/serine exporter family protein [Lactobacillus sp. ESL0684]|uniref:threonine/serine exporter family protein n=1 Tax=unclassified Lactobacillus TaxID=2620435 RepID=UPI0023F907BE|nr:MULTISPECIES: threonine/serine exporter family protein [unclassified Lactobacillus]WEV40488.1 threonine/serine exporter family protein [Lactobacillus sp. ESL0681]WEV43059.1 threonine/serine exporter family protein [Lactobacillus sp. ESL0684]